MSALQGDSHLTVSYTGREQEDTRKGQGSTKDQQQHAWAFSVMSGAGKGQIWGIIFWVKKFRRWQNWVFEWWMKCHLAGKHSIFQHLLCLVRNRSKQWQIPCTPILQVLKDDQIHISACSEGLSELRKLLPCSKHQSTDRNPLGNTPKHPLYLRICESLPSIPLTQSASQATSCGLGMCKSRAITASQTAISIFNITIPFAILFLCILKNTSGGIAAALLFCLAGWWCHLLLCPPLPCLNSETFAFPLLNLTGQKHCPGKEYVLSSWEKFSKT